MSSFYFVVQQTMFFAIPLLVVALGALISEKSGVINIAMEGIMIVGAFTGTLFISSMNGIIGGQWLYILAMVVAAIAGLLYSFFHAVASVRLKANQTISGTALNIFAPAMCIFVARMIFGAKQINFTDSFFIEKVPLLGNIPVLGPLFFRSCYISTFIGIGILLAVWFAIQKTAFGMRLSACGENPEAAASAGIKVNRMRLIGVLSSGALGGIGGIAFVVATSTSFSADVSGYGYLALAVLIMGQWKPIRVLIAAFFFGLLKAISSSYSGIPVLQNLPIASEVYKMIPYVLTLIVLVVCSGKSVAPKAEGKPYDDGSDTLQRKPKTAWIRPTVVAILLVALLAGTFRLEGKQGGKSNYTVSPGYGSEIALVFGSEGSVDDKSFCQGEWEGIVEYTRENNRTRKYYQATDSSYQSIVVAGDLAARGNAKIILLSSVTLEEAAYELQSKYPNIKFILVDGEPHPVGDKTPVYEPNMLAIAISEEESGFLAGYAAVKDGYRKMGFIGGMAVPAVIRYGYGFIAGADAAARELGLGKDDVSIRYNYAGVFTATPEALSLASSWYQSGTEVIFACGGTLGNSVMKAAENQGKSVIGVDVDQSSESPTVITSAMKNVKEITGYVLKKYENGEIQGGRRNRLTAKDGAVGLPMETSRFRAFTEEDYEKIYKKLITGEIVVEDNSAIPSADQIPTKCVKVTVIY